MRRRQLLVVSLRREVGNEHADGRAAVVRQRVERQVRRDQLAVGASQTRFALAGSLPALPQQIVVDRAVDRCDEVAERRADQFFVRRLEQLRQAQVAVDDGAVRLQRRRALLHLARPAVGRGGRRPRACKRGGRPVPRRRRHPPSPLRMARIVSSASSSRRRRSSFSACSFSSVMGSSGARVSCGAGPGPGARAPRRTGCRSSGAAAPAIS